MILPSICGGKLYYLAIVPESIPVSSALLYTIVGDILFWGWISISIIYAFACFSVYEKYIRLFVEAKLSSLHILMRLACYSVYICIYGQFTFYSASTVPKLISPTWGPSVANVLNVLISCLTSSPFNALIALITIWPVIGMILKKYKKSGRFHFRKISEGYLEEALEDQIKKQS